VARPAPRVAPGGGLTRGKGAGTLRG